MYKCLYIIFISLTAFSINGCNSVVHPSTNQDNKPSTLPEQTKEVERGYDPCLINANLPVCNNK